MAGELQSIIKIDLENIETQPLDALIAKLERLKAEFDAGAIGGEEFARQAQALADRWGAAASSLNEDDVAAVAGGLSDNAEQAKKAAAEAENLARAEGAVGEAMAQSTPEVETMSSALAKLGAKVGALGALKSAANAAASFQSAMGGVKKVADGTAEQFDALSQSLQTMAPQLGMMPEQLAEIAAAGGQMGMAVDKLDEFASLVGRMASAFGMQAEEAGKAVAGLQNIFKIQDLAEIERAADAINALANNTATNERDLINVMQRIGASAQLMGASADQAAALADAFLALGKSPETASTAINAMINRLMTIKTAGPDAQAALERIGFSAEEMARAMERDGIGAIKKFLSAAAELQGSERLEALTQIFGQGFADDIALAVGGVQSLDDALNIVAGDTLNSLNNEFEASMGSANKAMERAKIALRNIGITIGQAFLPVLTAAGNAASGVAVALDSVAKANPGLTKAIVLISSVRLALSSAQKTLALVGLAGAKAGAATASGAAVATTQTNALAAAADRAGASMARAAQSGNAMATAGGRIGAAAKSVAGSTLEPFAKSAAEATKSVGALVAGMARLASGIAAVAGAGAGGWTFGRQLVEQSDALQRYQVGLLNALNSVFKFYDGELKTMRQLDQELADADHWREVRLENIRKASAQRSKARQAEILAEAEAVKRSIENERLSLANMEKSGFDKQSLDERRKAIEGYQQQLKEIRDKYAETIGQGAANPLDEEAKKAKEALDFLGLSASDAQGKIGQTAQTAIESFKVAAQTYGSDAASIGRAFQAAAAKLDGAPALDALNAALKEAGVQAGLTATEIEAIGRNAKTSAQGAREAFAKLGVDMAEAVGGSSSKAKDKILDFAAALAALPKDAEGAGTLTRLAFEKAIGEMRAPQEFRDLKQAVEDSGKAALLSADQMARLNAGAQNGANEAKTKVAELGDALKKATDAASLAAFGSAARKAYEEGTIGAREFAGLAEKAAEHLGKMAREAKSAQEIAAAEKAIAQAAAAGIVTTDQAKEAAAALGEARARLAEATGEAAESAKGEAEAQTASAEASNAAAEAASRAAKSKADEAAASANAGAAASAAARKAGSAAEEMAASANRALGATFELGKISQEQWENLQRAQASIGGSLELTWRERDRLARRYLEDLKRATDATEALNQKVADGTVSAGDLSAAIRAAHSSSAKLDSVTLGGLQGAIEAAKAKMGALADEARSARQAAEDELAGLTKGEGERERIAAQRKISELDAKAKDAAKRGNADEAKEYKKAVELEKRIAAEKQKARDAAARKAQEDERKAAAEKERRAREEKAKAEQKAKEERERAAKERAKAAKEEADRRAREAKAKAKQEQDERARQERAQKEAEAREAKAKDEQKETPKDNAAAARASAQAASDEAQSAERAAQARERIADAREREAGTLQGVAGPLREIDALGDAMRKAAGDAASALNAGGGMASVIINVDGKEAANVGPIAREAAEAIARAIDAAARETARSAAAYALKSLRDEAERRLKGREYI